MADPVNQLKQDDAEKAYAAASATKVDAPVAKPAAAKPVEAEIAAPAAAEPKPAVKAVAAEPAAAKPAVTKPAAKAKPVAAKAVKAPKLARKAPARKAPVNKAAARKAVKPAKPAPRRSAPVKSQSLTQPTPIKQLKEKIMATTQTTKKTADQFTGKIQDAVKDAQARARTALEKSQALLGDAGEFNKGNLEALVESGKILASGVQSMGKTYVAEVKSTFEAVQADVKELTAVKSPAELLQLQGSLLRKYFDNAVAYNSKNAEAALKLANDAFQPISNRVSLAVEKVRKAA
jgi:phasin family protein